MAAECCFPGCPEPPNQRDDGTHACTSHQRVHVHSSYLEDETHRHARQEGC